MEWSEDWTTDNLREFLDEVAEQWGGAHQFFNFGRLLSKLEDHDGYTFYRVLKTDTGYVFEQATNSAHADEENHAWADKFSKGWACNTDGLYIITNADCEMWGEAK